MLNICITNCNNIDSGSISLIENQLNIKYAINGTGKSTLAQALEYNKSEKLLELTPYKFLNELPLEDNHQPKVQCSDEIQNIKIFNENFVDDFLFKQNEVMENSFEIFVKTNDYDIQMEKIQNMIKDIQNAFKENPDLDQLINDLNILISGYGNAKGISKNSSIGKGLAKGNKIVNIPNELKEYRPYIQSDIRATWLAWQSKGNPFLDVAEQCPYCAKELPNVQKQVIQKVSEEYDSKYIAELQKMLEIFKSLENYFVDSVNEKINKFKNSNIELNEDEKNYLTGIRSQVTYLHDRLFGIKSLNFAVLKDVSTVIDELRKKKIDLSLYEYINSDYTNKRIDIVNQALDNIIQQAGKLQGEINIQKDLIKKTIEKYHNEINLFLENAGYKYQVSINENINDNTYRMNLKSSENNIKVDNVKMHLSFGEKNAFALVLFMYKTLKENPDLIILDDPISSFDKNKKYAILEMLFQGAGTFQGKTVMMLTHDFDPIVDLIHTSSIKCRFNPNPVASFLYNENGVLYEKEILQKDILSFYEIANINIKGNIDIINKFIYLRRRYEALGDKGLEWQLLSNLFHPNRENPIMQDINGNREMTQEEITEAILGIQEEIPEFDDYMGIYNRAHDSLEMISLYKAPNISNYEKIQLYRIINHGHIPDTILKKFVDEAYHIENDNLFQLNPTEYPTIPEYIIKLCDNGIALLEEGMEYE